MIVQLGAEANVRRIEVDTAFFKGNYPDTCSVEGINAPEASAEELKSAAWKRVLPKSKLQANERHIFRRELSKMNDCTHVRLNIYPDGGVSRLRVWGTFA